MVKKQPRALEPLINTQVRLIARCMLSTLRIASWTSIESVSI